MRCSTQQKLNKFRKGYHCALKKKQKNFTQRESDEEPMLNRKKKKSINCLDPFNAQHSHDTLFWRDSLHSFNTYAECLYGVKELTDELYLCNI